MEIRYSLFAVLLTILGLHGNFKVHDASYQKYAGGRPASGYGTHYKLELIAKTNSDKLVVNKLWIGDNFFNVEAFADPNNRQNYNFEKGDTLYIKAQNHIKTDADGNVIAGDKNWEKPPKEVPENGALIGYYLNGRLRYKKVDKLRELPKQHRP